MLTRTSDLVDRLRREGGELNAEAADEIERLLDLVFAPSLAWDGYLVSGLGESIDEVYRLVLAAKKAKAA
jgi:hypothetical protein